jgi:hypothetical protein
MESTFGDQNNPKRPRVFGKHLRRSDDADQPKTAVLDGTPPSSRASWGPPTKAALADGRPPTGLTPLAETGPRQ